METATADNDRFTQIKQSFLMTFFIGVYQILSAVAFRISFVRASIDT